MKPLSPSRKASLGMTAVLGIAVAAGAGSALFNSHAARATSVRAELPTMPEAVLAAPVTEAESASASVSGSVLQTLAASKYTYLRLATPSGEVWTAVPAASVAVGSRVTVENAARMTAFKSATLKRTFDVIYFGTLAAAPPPAAASGFSPMDVLGEDEQDLPPGHPQIANPAAGPVDDTAPLPAGHPAIDGASASPHAGSADVAVAPLPAVTVTRASGGNAHVIAELSAERERLAGQRVRVRGQVTKVTPDVQGHTFFHLRDGKSGDSSPATDLVVTSNSTPSRGQVATFEGTLRADVDIGIGYRYSILLENAVLVPE